jgi:hypothetical protein
MLITNIEEIPGKKIVEHYAACPGRCGPRRPQHTQVRFSGILLSCGLP